MRIIGRETRKKRAGMAGEYCNREKWSEKAILAGGSNEKDLVGCNVNRVANVLNTFWIVYPTRRLKRGKASGAFYRVY